MKNTNVYEKPVTLKNILKFAVPTIAMTVFMSFYTMVDGLFVSNLIGTDALSAVNLTAPVIQLVTAVSTMLATGGSAVIMKKMGEQKVEEAREDFTFLILVNVMVGIIMCAAGYLVMDHIFAGMHLSAEVEGYCTAYLSRYLVFTVPILLMNNFTLYMIASEKAALSLICSVTGGVLNMGLDYVLIAVFDMGISGAAIATGLGYSVTAVVGFFVFGRKKSLLHFKKPAFRCKVLTNAAANGCSEMATALVTGIITMMFNWTMLRYVGEDGVAAVTIIMYVLMFASSLYTGYSYGVAPMLSFYYGEQNREKLKELYSKNFSLESLGVDVTSVDEKFMQKLYATLQQNIANSDLNLDAFCKELGLSKSNLYRKIKQITGYSPNEFIRNFRLETAAKMLKETDMTITEVYCAVGYNSLAYFSNCFKALYGMSPTEFKNKQEGK